MGGTEKDALKEEAQKDDWKEVQEWTLCNKKHRKRGPHGRCKNGFTARRGARMDALKEEAQK